MSPFFTFQSLSNATFNYIYLYMSMYTYMCVCVSMFVCVFGQFIKLILKVIPCESLVFFFYFKNELNLVLKVKLKKILC